MKQKSFQLVQSFRWIEIVANIQETFTKFKI